MILIQETYATLKIMNTYFVKMLVIANIDELVISFTASFDDSRVSDTGKNVFNNRKNNSKGSIIRLYVILAPQATPLTGIIEAIIEYSISDSTI